KRAGSHDGWALRRASEPLVLAEGAVPALFTAIRDEQHIPIVLVSPTAEGAHVLETLARRYPLVALSARQEASATPARPTILASAGRESIAILPDLLAGAAGDVERRAEQSRLAALMDEAVAAGVLTEPHLAGRLACGEEEVAARLSAPTAESLRASRHLRY